MHNSIPPPPDGVRMLVVNIGGEQQVFYLPDPPPKTWTRQPQEQEPGEYLFGGRFLVTQGVGQELSPLEILWMVADIKDAVKAHGTLDYLQVFHCEDGRVVWVIDQLSKSALASDEYTEEDNVFTMLWPSDY